MYKCPDRRSAFTYWEEDIPCRIDLVKTTSMEDPVRKEEVDDTNDIPTHCSTALVSSRVSSVRTSG